MKTKDWFARFDVLRPRRQSALCSWSLFQIVSLLIWCSAEIVSAFTIDSTTFIVPQTTVQLTGGTTYFFEVTAYEAAGQSLPSNEVSYTAP